MTKKLRLHTTISENGRLGFRSFWIRNVLQLVAERKVYMRKLFKEGAFDKMIKDAAHAAGRKPSIHIETGLLERVRKYGYGRLVAQLAQPTVRDFDRQLQKAEKLMSDDVRTQIDIRKLVMATERVVKHCKFPNSKFRPTSLDLVCEYQINKQASSGFPKYQRKGHILGELKQQAQRVHEGWREPFFWPLTRGFRLQIRKSQEGPQLKTRVIYPYPGCLILLEDQFIMPFVKHFIENDTFYVIGRNGRQISKLLKKRFNLRGIKRITSTDISSFDQNALNEFIIAAFSILRTQMHLTRKEMSIFEQLVAYFCTSLSVSKNSGQQAYGFLKVKGVPSGSGFTNMIDTLLHAICLEYCHPGFLTQTNALICGDDNIFISDGIDLQELYEALFYHCNFSISPEKSESFRSWVKVNFLGFEWRQGVRYQDPQLLINQMLWHTSFRKDLSKFDRELARAASVLLNARNGCDMFKSLFPETIADLNRGVDVRFTYLFGYQPPTTLPSVYGYVKVKQVKQTMPSINASLKLHLAEGYMIR